MDFKPINTQEEFETAVKDRIAREKDTVLRKYADYDDLKAKAARYDTEKTTFDTALAAANGKIADYEKQIGDLNGKIKGFETDSLKTQIALQTGLPYEMRSRLKGETEDEIKKDAQDLFKLMGTQRTVLPLGDPEPTVDSKTAAVKALRDGLLKGE